MKPTLPLAIFALVVPLAAFASSGGRIQVDPTLGCNQCHAGGAVPIVQLGLPSGAIAPGSTHSLTAQVQAVNEDANGKGWAGFNLVATTGTLSSSTTEVQILLGEATHTAPKQEGVFSPLVEFAVQWTAPATAQSVTFQLWGNAVNHNGGTSGDRAAKTTVTCDVRYPDQDNDGFGSGAGVIACQPLTGYVAVFGDCNDANGSINPGATETCNMVDDDCDGAIDEGFATTWYADVDGDSYGDSTTAVNACTQPSGTVANGTDCDDGNANVHPGATETCNAADDDCDGTPDDGAVDAVTWYVDADGDTFGTTSSTQACTMPSGYAATSTDCDDTKASVNPGATEVCNAVDDDCDGTVDDGLPLLTFYVDADNDGAGSAQTVQDCMQPPNTSVSTGDCNDADATVKPGMVESCNMRDDDCDGSVDEGAKTTFFADIDNDLFGDASNTTEACALPTGYVANSMDCDDSRSDVNPNGAETCDAADEDCDGTADDGVPNSTCGQGICARTGTTCEASSCTPGLSAVETCNGLDDDCNGMVDDDPQGLCPGDEVCMPLDAGVAACAVPPEEDAGTGLDAGVDAGSSAKDAGISGGEEPPAGCGCGAAGGSFWVVLGAAALSLALSRRNRRGGTAARGPFRSQ